MNRKTLYLHIGITVLVSSLTTFLLVGWFYEKSTLVSRTGIDTSASSAVFDRNATTTLLTYESAVITTVEKANPAVVAIVISKEIPIYEPYLENIPGLFGNIFQFPQWRQQGIEEQEIGGGSGFFVSADGYVVTNSHVVADESADYTILMNDGRRHKATIVAQDPVVDLAVLKVEGTDFPFLPFGDSDALQIGQSVIAIGNALAEFRNTVSLGIVSGLARSIVASDGAGNTEALNQLIQTDAAINQGNSGGPLLNLSGEVVGVNVAVASGAENIGFAVNSNTVEQAVASVREYGKIIRPYLGIRYIPVTPQIQEQYGLKNDFGVLIVSDSQSLNPVVPGSPAAKAGIAEDDVILEIDGVRITEETPLTAVLRTKDVGDTVTLTLERRGEIIERTAQLEASEE